MATQIATIIVNFNSNYAGCHRLFWRKGGAGPYTGPIEATPPCTGGGAPCSITFYDIVDTESCDNVVYDGYVQACCEPVSSLIGRIPWTTSFTPSPTCFPVTITCYATEVLSIEVTTENTTFYAVPPAVTLIGGGFSSLATADAIIGTGEITNLLILVPGTGPDVAPGSYGPVGGINIVGSGTAVQVTATSLNSVVGPPYPSGGFTYLNTITLVSSSADWSVGDTFEIDPSSIGNIAGVLIEVGATDEGKIIGFTITDPGAGYTTPPLVSISPQDPGDPFAAEVFLAPCPNGWTVGPNCDGVDYSAFPIEPKIGQSFSMCFDGGGITSGSLPGEYQSAVNTTDCCTTCVRVQFQNLGAAPVDVSWLDCDVNSATYKDVISDTVPAFGALIVCCAVENSWALEDTTVTVAVLGPCADCPPPGP